MSAKQLNRRHLGLDASNLRGGGGVTHLIELLRHAQPQEFGFERVTVWAGLSTLAKLEDRVWLNKQHNPFLDRPLPYRVYWQTHLRDQEIKQADCDFLFVPGGNYSGSFRPFVTMSRNLLPFQWSEARRYGLSLMLFKLLALHYTQSHTMQRADGVIFLTEYARDVVMSDIKQIRGQSIVIPHGINKEFAFPPRPQKSIDQYSTQNPFRILYVSIVDVYKHQWHVAEAIAALKHKGLPVRLELIGPAYGPALKRLKRALSKFDPGEQFIHYRGAVSYPELHREYQQADMFVFASTCETFGQIVTETMSAGLPIACSNTGTMRELLKEDAVYFDPEQPSEIADSLLVLLRDPAKRKMMADSAYERAKTYSWERCAHETFDFLENVIRTL
ncbi:glycosyltransferase [bacterium]|nr:glycosyltransferase [bacterium]